MSTRSPASRSGTFSLGGTTTVARLGFGTMRLTGSGVWGEPDDPQQAIRVLRRAVELGVNFIDTADSYGPAVAEQLIRRALHPYADDLVIATKAGLARTGPGKWHPLGRPEYLKQQAEMSLRNLGVERIGLFQLHRIDPLVPLADQLGALTELQREGKIQHIGLSEVSAAQLREAQGLAPVVSVQNLFNLSNRSAADVLALCETQGLAFIPWFPLATGQLSAADGPLQSIARDTQATPSQLALAWLLARSPVMLPIPGTSSIAHLEENMGAAEVTLTAEQLSALDAATG